MDDILRAELARAFAPHFSSADLAVLLPAVARAVRRSLDATSTMDASMRMRTVAGATTTPLVDFCAARAGAGVGGGALEEIVGFRAALAERMAASLVRLRGEYLEGGKGAAPAGPYLGKSRKVYEFVRVSLGVRMHGRENLRGFEAGPGVEEETIGQEISRIHEAIRDGKMQDVVVGLFA